MGYNDGNSGIRNKLYVILIIFIVIIGFFVVISALYILSSNTNIEVPTTPATIVSPAPDRWLPAGIPALPDTSTDDDLTVLSLYRAVDTLLNDQQTDRWVYDNPDWRLVYASSDWVKNNGLSYEWHIILQGNNNILTANVKNGSVVNVNVQSTGVKVINSTDLEHMWDSNWVMYQLVGNSNVYNRYSDKTFAVVFTDDGNTGVYDITYDDRTNIRYSVDVKVDAMTGNTLEGEVRQYD